MSTAQSIRDMLADIAQQDFPVLAVPPGPWSYKVTAVRQDGRCDLAAVKVGPPPEILNVDHWSASGTNSYPAVGSVVVVAFLDGDEAQPMIVSYTPLRVAGGVPTDATIDATVLHLGPSATLVQLAPSPFAILKPVARVGDTVDCGFLTAAMVAGVPVISVAPGPASPTVVAITGKITSGSPKVTSG